VDGRARVYGVEAAGELGVGFELGWAAAELTGMGENHGGATVYGLNYAADLNIKIAILAELAYLVVIIPGADDRETAVVVGDLRRADIEEASSIGKLHHVIDMR
jgi:hypothetical protein